jgi:hypothetical protein
VAKKRCQSKRGEIVKDPSKIGGIIVARRFSIAKESNMKETEGSGGMHAGMIDMSFA